MLGCYFLTSHGGHGVGYPTLVQVVPGICTGTSNLTLRQSPKYSLFQSRVGRDHSRCHLKKSFPYLNFLVSCSFLSGKVYPNARRLKRITWDESRSKNSPKQLATPEGISQLGPNCLNSKAPENSSTRKNSCAPVPGSGLQILGFGFRVPGFEFSLGFIWELRYLYHSMYQQNGFRKSPPPQNC